MSDKKSGWFGRKRAVASARMPAPRQRRSGIILLEPRVMYDGAAAATAAAAHHHHHDGGAPSDPGQAGGAAVGGAGAPTPSGGDGHWHHEATPAEPMPHVATFVKDPTEIVFIDAQVPDAQLLAQGARPGVEVVMLDANSDGVDQIANFLKRHPDPNLTTIDIVGHGADGVVQLGTTLLSSNTIGQYQTQLAAIGNAMLPGGNIQLYGCDVAHDSSGDLFLMQLSQATGGKNVDAASGLVGAAALGGSWNLDVDIGGTSAANLANPFTDATLAAFPDVLPNAPALIYFDTWNGEGGGVVGQGNMVEQLTANGSTLVSSSNVINDGSPINPSGPNSNPNPALTDTTGFVVDTALNEYFLASYNGGTFTWSIQEGSLSGGALTTLYTVPFPALNANFTPGGKPIIGTAVMLGGLALDATSGELYFAQDAENYQTGDYVPAETGIYRISVTGGPATLVTSTATAPSNPVYMVLDTADNLVFFDDSIEAGGGFPAVNNLDVANLTTGAVAVLKSFTSSDTNFSLQGLDIDTANQTLYLATADLATANSASNAILRYTYSVSGSGSTATASVGGATTLYSGSNAFQPTDIVVDAQAGIFYATGSAPYTVSFDGTGSDAAIFEGSLTGGSALSEVLAVSSILPAPTPSTGAAAYLTHAPQLYLATPPVVTVSGLTPTYDAGGAAVTVDSGVTVSDNSSADLFNATVSITTHFQSGDVLGIPAADLNGSTVKGTSITESYNSSTGVLTLSGTDTIADYQLALREVTFSSTLAAPSNLARTITFSASDSVASSDGATDAVNIHDAPIVTAGGTATFNGGGSAVHLDSALTLSDVSSTTQASATVSIGAGFISGDILSVGTPGGLSVSYDAVHGVLTLSGLASNATYQTALESITYGFTAGADPTSGGSHTTRTVDWVVNDGVTSSATAISSLTTVHVAPTVTPSGLTASFTGGGAAVVLDSGIGVNDGDSAGNLSGATVSIGAGFLVGDTLNFATQNGISSSYTAATGVLTLSGSTTLANYKTALESITYSFTAGGDPINGGVDTTRTINWTVSDGSSTNGTSAAKTSSLTTVHVAPTVTAGASATFNSGGAAALLDGTLTVADVDSGGNLQSATVSIGTGFVVGDVLSFTAQAGITASYTSATGVLKLSGKASLATYQTELDSISFSTNAAVAGSRVINWVVSDGSTSQGSNTAATSTLTVRTGPSISGAGTTVNYQETGAAVVVDSGLGLTDASGANIASATVTISSGFVSGDVLGIPAADLTGNIFTATNITESYNASSGVLTLVGSDTAAHYQSVLDAVTYGFTANPATAGAARSVSYSAIDANGISTAAGATNTVDLVHTAPVVTAGGTAIFTGGGIAAPLDPLLTLSDVDSGGNLAGATVSISAGFFNGDTLNFTNQNGITGSYNAASGVLILSGTDTVGNYQAALDSITYSFAPPNGDPTGGGSHTVRTVNWTVSDGSTNNGGSNTATSTLDTVRVAPLVTAGTPSVTFIGGGGAVTLDSGLALSDADSGNNLAGATVSIGIGFIGGDTLNFINQNGITGSYNATTGVLTLGGAASVANYQTALDSITYSFSPTNSDPTAGGADTARTVNWSVSDGSVTHGSSNIASTTLGTVHVAPVVTAGAAVVTFTGGGGAVTLDSGLTLSDADSAGKLAGATVSIGTGFVSGDVLNFINQSGITGSYNAATGVLTLNGTATVANYQTALDSVTYSFAANGDPTAGGADIARTINWNVSDGSTSNGASNTGTSTLDTVHVAPTVAAGGTVTFTGGGAAVTLDSGLTLSDIDSGGSLTGATVSIGSGFIAGDFLNFTNQNGISGSYDAVHGILSLSGTASIANYQTALDSVSYTDGNGDPTGGGSDTSRSINWSVTDGVASSSTATSSLHTVHVAPTVTAGAVAAYQGGGSPATLDSTLTIVDNNSGGKLVGASVQIVGPFSGDTLSFTSPDNIITGSYNPSTGVLTLSGTDTKANYQTALESVTYSFAGNGDPTVGGANTARSIYWVVNDGNTVNGTNEVLPAPNASVALNNDQPSLGLNQIVVENGFFPTRDGSGDAGGIPLGSVRTLAGTVTPGGTQAADGQPLSISSNTALFSLLGTNYGGDGVSTFGLPNLQGTLAAGFEGSNPNFRLGESYGSHEFTLTRANLPHRWGGAGIAFDNDQPTQTVNYIINTAGTFGGSVDSLGTVVPFLGDFAPTGYMEANGQLLNIAQHSALFSILGTAYGGDGITTFALPDLNGRTIIGAGSDTRTANFVAIGTTTGQDDTLLTLSNLPPPQGASQAISNDQPSVALTYLVATTGIFPNAGSPPSPGQQYIGEVIAWAGSSNSGSFQSMLDAGWMVAAGQLLPIDTNNSLFQVLGTTYGGNGTSTFALPDLVGRSIAGLGNSQGQTTTLGEQFGSDTVNIPFGQSLESLLPTVATSTLSIVHTPPTVSAGATAIFETASPTPVALDSTLTVNDLDSGGNLASATVSIGSGFVSGQDSLDFTNQNNITGSYNAGTGVLTLSGSDTLADYQAALDSISFSTNSANAGTRTIHWVANDGVSSSAVASSTVDVIRGAQVTAGASVNYTQGGGVVALDPGLDVTDLVHTTLASATVSIGTGFTTSDVLNFTNQSNITGSYNSSTGMLTLNGVDTVADYKTALESISYGFSPANGDPTVGRLDTSRTINWSVNDGTVNSAAVTSRVTTAQSTPAGTVLVVTPSGTTATFDQGGPAATIDRGITVTDSNATDLTGATVTISANFQSGDMLLVDGNSNGVIHNGANGTISYAFSGGTLSLTGADTVADYQTALSEVSFTNPFTPSIVPRSVTFSATDGTASGSAVETVLIRDEPVVTVGTPLVTFTGGGAAATLDSGLTLSDPSSNMLASATVTIVSGGQPGDVLNFNGTNTETFGDGKTITASFSGGELILSGTASVADYRTALEQVQFNFTAGGDPTGGAANAITRDITWQVSDGHLQSSIAGAQTGLDVVHTAPFVSPSGTIATFTGGGSAVPLDGGLVVEDADSGGNLTGATVSIGGFVTGDTLSVGTDGGLTVGYDATTGILSLSGSASLATYQTALDSISYSFTSGGDPTAGGTQTTRTIDWSVSDGAASNGTSATATSTLDVIHVAPTVTPSGAAATFTGGGSAQLLDAGLKVGDVDSGGNLTSATVSISGFVNGDTLSVGTDGGLIVGYDSTHGILSLSGSASLATYQTALDSISYSFTNGGDPTADGTQTTRTIDWSVTDASTSNGASNTATSTLDVIHVAPTVTPSGAIATFTGGGAAVPLDGALKVDDVDSGGNLTSATVSIGGFVTGDTLTVGTTGGLTVGYDATHGILSLSGSASLTTYQTALDSITYSFTSGGDPTAAGTQTTRTIDWSVTDASTSNGISNTATSTLDLVHVAPTVTPSGATATFAGGGSPVALDNALMVGDVDSGGKLTGATVSIGGFVSGDTLTVGTMGGLTVGYDSTTGTLSLSGSASLATYQTALDSISYSFTNGGDPTAGGMQTTRTINWSVTDASSSNGVSNTATSTLDTVHVAPTVTAGAIATFTGGGAAVTLDGGLTVSDVDSGGNLTGATVSIGGFVNGDTLAVGTAGGLTVGYDSTHGILSLSGLASSSTYQTALDSISYSFTNGGDPTAGGTQTTRTIDWSVTDTSSSNGISKTATSTLDVVHAAPTVTPSGAVATFSGGGAAVTLDGALKVSDADSGGNLATATVSIGGFVNGDTLTVGTTGGLIVGYDSTTGTLSLSGSASLTTYQTALDSITYSFTSGADPTAGGTHTSRTIDWSVTDASSSNGGSNTANSTLDVIHVPPTLATGGTVTYVQAGTPAQLDSTLTLSDPDSGDLLTGATVQITAGLLTGDALNADTTGLPSIIASYDSASGELTLKGSDTLADYQAVLRSVTFDSTSGNPTSTGADPSRTVTWTVSDAVSSNAITQTSGIDIHALPIVTPSGAIATFSGGGSAVTLDGALAVSDTSSTTLAGATVSIGSGLQSGDVLSFNNGTNTETFVGDGKTITASFSGGELILSGTAAVADYQAALEQVQFSFTANSDPTNGGGDTTRAIGWSVNDGPASSAAAANTLDTVHVAPTVTPSGATSVFTGGGSPVPVDGGITVNDIDSGGHLSSATVTISANAIAGDRLDFNQGTAVSYGDGGSIIGSFSGTTLTLTGTNASIADFNAALDAVTYSFSPVNGDPTNGGGDTARTISWTVSDGNTSNGASVAVTSTLDTVHAAPVVTAGAAATFEIGGTATQLDSGLTISDADSLGKLSSATVSIGAGFIGGGDDFLSFINQNNITGSYNFGTGVLTLTGSDSIDDYRAALQSITFRTNSTTVGSRTIDWTVSDLASSSAQATSTVIVESGPQVMAGGTATFTGGGAAVSLDAALTIIDQSNPTLQSATVSIGSGFIAGDMLSFTSQSGITGSYDAVHGVLTLTGNASAPAYQAALESVTYSYTAGADPTAGGVDTVRTINWVANDGAPNSTPATSTLDVVHAPPVVTVGTPSATFTGGGSPATLDGVTSSSPGVIVVAPDSGGNLTGATVTIGSGLQSGDVLSFNGTNTETFAADGKTITGSYDSSTGVLTLSGTASQADYQAALDQVQFSFSPANGDPTAGGGDTSRGITWQVNDGVSLSSLTGATTTLTVVHAAPILTAGATSSFDGRTAIALDGGLTLTDADSGGNLTGATVSIDVGSAHAGLLSGDTLNFTNQNGITGSYNAATGVLTLTGTASVANYQAALDSVTFSFTPATADPTGGAANDASRTITWTVTDGSTSHGSATATSTLNVAANLVPPPLGSVQAPIPGNFDHGHFGDFSGMVTNAQFGGPAGPVFGSGNALYVVHSDVNPTVADNGTVGFDLALNQLEAALGGDVVSVSATLADGKPLPSWLHFDSDTGQFAGLVPDDFATGSIGPDGAFNDGQGGSSLPQLMTIEVVARDSRGNLAVTDFTINLSTHRADRHGWNVLPGKQFIDPWGNVRQRRDFASHSGLGPHRDIVAPHALDRSADHVAWHVPALDTDRVHVDHEAGPAPSGRAGLSDQIKAHGWRAVAAQRTALLDSLRQGVAGWR